MAVAASWAAILSAKVRERREVFEKERHLLSVRGHHGQSIDLESDESQASRMKKRVWRGMSWDLEAESKLETLLINIDRLFNVMTL